MSNINPLSYKLSLALIKYMPMILAACDMLNTLFWLFKINCFYLSYIGGISFLTIVLLYLLSYTFKFCFHHRIFIHYLVLNNILSIFDYYNIISIPIIIYLLLIGVTCFIFLYCHVKKLKKDRNESNIIK